MATHHGKEGAVYLGANQIAEVMSWSFSDSIDLADDSNMTDTARSYLTGKTDANGTIECHWDETDTNGQEALTLGASVTLNLYPEGNASGDAYWTGTAIVESRNFGGDGDSTIKATFNWKASGGMTYTTV